MDVPFFVPSIQEHHLRLMNGVMGHLALAPIPTVNVDSLCGKWSVGKEKLYQILATMEAIGLINIVRHKTDRKASGKGAKIFFADPSIYGALNGSLGNLREAFVVAAFRQAGKTVYASKEEQDYDFIVDGVTVEVGGQGKKPKKAALVIRDDMERPAAKSIPLWSLGMMY